MTDPLAIPVRRRTKRRLALGVAIGIIAAIAVASAVGPHPLARQKLPKPNGYDDLTRAGSLFKGELPNKGDLDRADPASVRSLVEANKPALDLARVGLSRDGLAHFEDSQEGLGEQMEAQGRLKQVARLLTAESIAAVNYAKRRSEGRVADASRSLLDVIRVGQVATQGEMLMGAQHGWFLQKRAADRLRKIRDRLSADDCRSILRGLEPLDDKRVTADAVMARWERWYRGAFGLVPRMILAWGGVEATERSTQQFQTKKAHDEVARAMRFLMVELAIHAYHGDKGAWPRSVGDLVPAYLASAPIDPATGKPLDYPANPSGELTDDLGSIARPDGEVGPRS